MEEWETLQAHKGVFGYPLELLCQLLDLERHITRLSKTERETLLCMMAGLTVRTAGALLGRSKSEQARLQTFALERLTTYMNGGR